jgi:putative heme iron utilization protein
MSHITEKDNVVMTRIDQNGFDLEVNGENVRYELEKPMKEPREVRKVLVTLARKVLPDK